MTGNIAFGIYCLFVGLFVSVVSKNVVWSVPNCDAGRNIRQRQTTGCMEGTRSTVKNVGGETQQTPATGHYRLQHCENRDNYRH